MGKQPATFTPAQIAAANAVKNGNKTPKDVLKAFLAGDMAFRDVKIPPLDLARFMALEDIDSPLLDAPESKREMKARDIATALVLITSTLEDCRRLVNDVEALEKMVWQFAEKIKLSDMMAAGRALAETIASGFRTVIAAEKKTVKPTRSQKAEAPASAGD